eukprot:g48373.t1
MKRAVKRLRTRATRARLPVTIRRDGFKVGVGVRRAHVAWDTAISPLWVDLFIPASKTDYMRTGSYVRLWRNNSETCPFSMLLAAWDAATDKRPTAPLFQDSKGNALSYKLLQKILRSLVRQSDSTLHSTALTACGLAALRPSRWQALSNDSWQVASASARMGALGSARSAASLREVCWVAGCPSRKSCAGRQMTSTTSPHASPDKVAEGPLIIKFPPAHRYRNVTVDKGGFSPTHRYRNVTVDKGGFSPTHVVPDPRTGEGFQRSFRSWLFPAAPSMTASLVCTTSLGPASPAPSNAASPFCTSSPLATIFSSTSLSLYRPASALPRYAGASSSPPLSPRSIRALVRTCSRRLADLASYSFSPRPRVSSALAEGPLIIKFPPAHRYRNNRSVFRFSSNSPSPFVKG